MSKHTPGPWRYKLDGGQDSDTRHAVLADSTGLWVAATYRSGTSAKNHRSQEAEAEAKANARLIAAAPELLEALQELCDTLGECGMTEKARAVIAEATGEQA